jgi:hypothetical protein
MHEAAAAGQLLDLLDEDRAAQRVALVYRAASPVGARPSLGWFCRSATTRVEVRSVSPSRGTRRKARPR